MTVVFWLSLFFVGYTVVGYPFLLHLMVIWKRKVANRGQLRETGVPQLRTEKIANEEDDLASIASAGDWPPISIVLICYNEADRIEARLTNLAECDYPGERELVTVCGGCTDDTVSRAKNWVGDLCTRIIEIPERQSKAAGLNRGVEEAKHEIVVFADARQKFNRVALRKLVKPLSDSQVAAVSGNLEVAASEVGAGLGIDVYWRIEKLIRRLESEIDSVIGCTGAIYSLRKMYFEPIPPDTILDDVVIPMRALVAGKRVLFESGAVAFDPQNLSPKIERRRKIRTLAGNYQMLFRYVSWMSPRKNRAWWQLISHKYLRLACPFFLMVCLVASAVLAKEDLFYRLVFFAQLACYGFAILGMVFQGVRSPLFTAPAGFVFLQWQGLRALFHYLRLRRSPEAGVW